jgi:DNA-binding NarL/FixJ family response regulator
MTTVLLIDAPLAVRHALRTRLSLEPDLAIVGEADDSVQALKLAESLDPDVVLLDAEMPDLDVASIVHALSRSDPDRGIVVISQRAEALMQSLEGTRTVVVGKHEGLSSLVGAIRSAASRRGARHHYGNGPGESL